MTTSYASMHDNDPREGDITYYAMIKDIIELSFNEGTERLFYLSVTGSIAKQTNMASHLLTL